MMQTMRFTQISTALAAFLFVAGAARAVTNCTTTSNVGGNLTLTDHYATTSGSNTCLNITAANAVLTAMASRSHATTLAGAGRRFKSLRTASP